jgi:hypothetical protein
MIQLQPYLKENLKQDTLEQVAGLISDRQDEYAGNSMTVAVIATIGTELILWAMISGIMGLIHHFVK